MLNITTRGFTGHEHIEHADIIHMNGRIFDPTLGRFLQADPFVQAPENSQSLNRYAYIFNNPLSGTDPSGYFGFLKKAFNKVFRGINKVLGDFAPLVGIGLAILAPWGTGFWESVSYGFIGGGIASGSLNGALLGAFSAGVFQQIGQHFSEKGFWNRVGDGHGAVDPKTLTDFGGNALTSGQIAAQIASHAAAGGVISTLSGGKFGHGFFSAGFTKAAGGAFLPGGSDLSTGEVVGGTLASAVIGGTASVISGGKFSNGARTATYQYLFNQASSSIRQNGFIETMKSWGKTIQGWGPGIADSLNGLYDGSASVFTGSYRSVRYLGRSSGLLGQGEFDAAIQEGLLMDKAIVEAYNNPQAVMDSTSEAFRYARENANAYNTSRVIGRTVTGIALAPLGALAAVGDITFGIEQGYTSLQSQLERAFYGSN